MADIVPIRVCRANINLQGATAILEYHTIDSPLAQPRNALFGQVFSATIGISITKLFNLSVHFESVRWVAGALAVGVASAFMGLTKTVHPPAGATALLCATEPAITALGWMFLPMIILGTTLLLAVALLLNNIQRQFPVYWWTPADLRLPLKVDDIERVPSSAEKTEEAPTASSSITQIMDEERIVINKEHIFVPDWLALDDEEKAALEILHTKLLHGCERV
jgi:CBS-domain-containing membrane protein